MSGELLPDSGLIEFAGRDITQLPPYTRSHLGLARSFQITNIFLGMTLLENVALAVQAHAGHSYRFWRAARDDKRLREPALATLHQVNLSDRANVLASEVSHGEQRQLEIAMALATNPKIIVIGRADGGNGNRRIGAHGRYSEKSEPTKNHAID